MSGVKELLKKLFQTGEQCVYCGREIPAGTLACTACAKEEAALYAEDGRAGGVLHLFRYDGVVRQLIHSMKYGDMPRYAFFIAQRMYEFLDGYEVGADLLTFVPVHANRLKTRGFDQSELIASHLSLLTGIPCVRLLDRVKDTAPQFSLGGSERIQNVEGAFARHGNMDLREKSVLVIDDIYTSGATIGGCIECLAEEAVAVPFVFSKEY